LRSGGCFNVETLNLGKGPDDDAENNWTQAPPTHPNFKSHHIGMFTNQQSVSHCFKARKIWLISQRGSF
jgi:hypothetical protein